MSTTTTTASWAQRGQLDPLGRILVGTTRAGVDWWAPADRFEAMRERFDLRECFVERGLTGDIWGDCSPYGPCPCSDCRILRAQCA
jgi:hypothetical protein